MADFVVRRSSWINPKTGNTGYGYYIPVTVRGVRFDIKLAPKKDKSNYDMLDIVFKGKDELPLTIEEGSLIDQNTGQSIIFTTLSVSDSDTDENGNIVTYTALLDFKDGASKKVWKDNNPVPAK